MKKLLFLFTVAAALNVYSQQNSVQQYSPVVKLTTEQDHQRIMKLLGIDSLRPGRNGMNPKAANYANYDETKANLFPVLPDLMTLKNGKKVTSASMWIKKRKKELFEIFDKEIYGYTPKVTPKVKWELISTKNDTIGGILAVTKKLVGHVDNSSYPLITVDIQLSLTVPANAVNSIPVMVELSFPEFRRNNNNFKPPVQVGPTWKEQILSKGWACASYSPYSVQADNGAGLTEGIIGLVNKGEPRKVDDWGALKAWAWGMSKVIDYFETDKSVDAKRVGFEGHSRFGKTVLVAMAYDPRIAIIFCSSSGEAGAKLHRRDWGEIVENIASSGEYHWMAGNFIKYASSGYTWDSLPIDSHELIALCAPRPVFISSGTLEAGDGWVDAKGMFMAAAAAGPAYKILGKKDLGTTEFPPLETTLTDGDIAFRQHSGGHTPGPNWPTFIQFAERYFTVKK